MLNDKQRQDADQNIASMSELFPALWWGLYLGFSESQAFALLRTYIQATLGRGVLPDDSTPNSGKPE